MNNNNHDITDRDGDFTLFIVALGISIILNILSMADTVPIA